MNPLDALNQAVGSSNENEVLDEGQRLIQHLTITGASPNMLQYAGSRIREASTPEHISNIAKELAPEFEGLEETSVPGTVTGAIGNFQKHPIASTLEAGLSPLGLVGGKMVPKGGIINKAFETSRNIALNDLLGKSVEGPAAMVANPEEHPWLNLGANLALFGAGVHGLNNLRPSMLSAWRDLPENTVNAFRSGFGGDAPNFGRVGSILGSEAGSVEVPNVLRSTSDTVNDLYTKLANMETPLNKDSWLGKQLGGNTWDEMINNPMDRLQANPLTRDVGYAFEDTVRESDRMRQAMSTVAGKIGEWPLEKLNAFRNMLKEGIDINKASPEYQSEFAEIMQPMFNALTDSRAKLLNNVQQEKILNRTFTDQMKKLFLSDESDPHFQVAVANFKGDLSNPEETKGFLKSLIAHPGTPPETRQLALDMMDMKARVVEDVSNAYKNSFESVLTAKVLENPDWAKPLSGQVGEWMDDVKGGKLGEKVNSDYVAMNPKQYPEFKGMMVHRNIAEGFRDLNEVPSAARRFYSNYFLNPWKTLKVGLNAPARIRDLMTQVMFNDIDGAFPLSPFRVDQYARTLKMIKEDDPIYRQWKFWSGTEHQLNESDMRHIIGAMKHDAGPLDNAIRLLYDPTMFGGKNVLGHATKFGQTVMHTFDTITKLAKFDWNLQHGMEAREAAIDALKANGDPLRMSRAVRLAKDTAMPFFGWQSHALKVMGRGMANHPVRLAKYFAIPYFIGQQAIQQLGMNEEEWQQFKQSLPEYVSNSVFGMPTYIPMPWRDEKGRVQMFNLAWWTPGLQDMAELQERAGSVLGLIQHPALTMYAALSQNKKYSGAPIWHEWEPPTTKMSKAFSFIMEQMMPPLMPGYGNAFQKIWNSTVHSDDPASMTPTESFGSQLGYKVTPFDEGQQISNHQSLLKNWEAEARRQMNKELQKHPDSDSEQKAIIRKYTDILEDIGKRRGGEE